MNPEFMKAAICMLQETSKSLQQPLDLTIEVFREPGYDKT